MFIELITNKGEKLTFNTQHIVLVTPDRRGTLIVDINGMDWLVSESYESLKRIFQASDSDKSYKTI